MGGVRCGAAVGLWGLVWIWIFNPYDGKNCGGDFLNQFAGGGSVVFSLLKEKYSE